ncbi:hypothetical protein CONCODRAFT_12726 [Conidiobolus coronatus NRRL 28638]|uniref:F-box domain-containing protein n=1 Tax=Conidiobolus coronatus (strain ATCC 28846 / CBS 209.66 / NRRL 28638) TaxID=796925 RepID=A0A137NSF1_CONC2|nr:hypothetical protein CONCODRAFT_12726 [Conidiobolus coronatus NRRL 28638]|eukprot:KXN65622.1 hypothetical protein CONCODRAFT_12726 [Conidiobolus coronatus NRRL 28638]
MTRVLRSAAKKIQNSEDLSSKLSISKKSKNIKKTDNKALEIKNENNQQNSVWNINTILSNIFAYTDRKDLVEFNTVCKKWNNLSNPIIHKTIKLDSRWDDEWQQHYNKNNNATKINTDVLECISNNAKHAHLVKDFKFSYKMNPQRAVEIFETFRFIVNLTIENCKINQNQFLGMISPLVQLKELALRNLSIKNIIKKKPHKEVVQLPPSLKKLILGKIELIDNPELFVQAINSHRNLVEFKYDTDSNDNNFIEPFYKHYPSLLNFEFNYIWLESSQPLFAIFENNTQLVSLKLTLKCLSSELLSKISSNLIELEELKLSKNPYYSREDTEFFAKFSQPTKIKNLKLDCGRLSNCSLNSILLNCPQLEELDLNRITNMQRNSVKFISFSNPLKLKKLAIDCDDLSEGVFESILLNCKNINELKIVLPCKWEVAIQSIYEKVC